MANVSVAVLGLGRVGASIVLALRRYNERKDSPHTFEVTAADMRAGIRDDAAKVGLDRLEKDIFTAVRGKDIVVLALPYADVQDAYKAIATDLRPGTVVLDASPLKQPSLEWASRHLTAENHMVGITPILNPAYLFDGLDDTLHARADLFDKGNMLLMPGPSCIKEAIELASDFATILGSSPHFFDPVEHDSVAALTEGLPAVLALASFYMSAKSAGWADAQRVTNPAFGRLTRHLYDTHPDDLRDLLLNNRANTVRQIDELLIVLRTLRELISAGEQDALEAALLESSDNYNLWINRRAKAKWDDAAPADDGQSVGGMLMNGLMGGFLSRRLQGGKTSK